MECMYMPDRFNGPQWLTSVALFRKPHRELLKYEVCWLVAREIPFHGSFRG